MSFELDNHDIAMYLAVSLDSHGATLPQVIPAPHGTTLPQVIPAPHGATLPQVIPAHLWIRHSNDLHDS